MAALPPVDIEPQMRLRRTCSLGEANSVETLCQSQPNSSATNWARPVMLPCPISERAMRITTRSSGWITIQWVTSGPSPGVDMASSAWAGSENSSARAPPAATEALRNSRRSMAMVMASPSNFLAVGRERGLRRFRDLLAGRGVDGLAHPRVSAATAEVRHRGIDVGVGRLRVLLEERGRGHDH